jgi:hypothetical protein
MRRAIIPALLLVLVSVVLGATVFREQVAHAASNLNVFVTNDSAHPVPVREQNLDSGNIKVHEQGTANVNVTGGKVDLGATPIAGDFFASSIIGAPGDTFFRCSGVSGSVIASTAVLTAIGGSARFVLKKGADCTVTPPTGGLPVMNIVVAPDSSVAIPLRDRIEVNEAEITCGAGGCTASFDLNGQSG